MKEDKSNNVNKSYNIIDQVSLSLINTLTNILDKCDQIDLTEWNESVACSTCISLTAMLLKNKIVELTSSYIMNNILNTNNIRSVTNSVLVLGAILDGPVENSLDSIMTNVLINILNYLNNSKNDYLQYNCAWAISRIAEYCPK